MKKLAFTLAFLLLSTPCFAAARFLVPSAGACNGTWTDTDCWSTTSGGAGGSAAPGASDDVTFDTNSGSQNMSLNGATRSVLSLTMLSGYTGTLQLTNQILLISTAGSFTMVAGASVTSTGITGFVSCAGTCSLTAAGQSFPGSISTSSSSTVTFADAWVIAGDFNNSASTPSVNCTGGSVSFAGSVNFSAMTTTNATGTCTFIFTGTGSLTAASLTTGTLQFGITINTAGTFTWPNTTLRFAGSKTLTYTAGTIVVGSGTQQFAGAFTVATTGTPTLFSTYSVTSGNQTVTGSFNCATYSQTLGSASTTHTWTNGITVGVTSSLIITGQATGVGQGHFLITASAGTVNLNYTGSTVALAYADFTNVVASGTALKTYQGTLSGTTTGISQITSIGSGSGGGLIGG